MNRLRDMREDKDLRQEDVAKILNVSRQYYSRYELEQVELPIRHYKTLARLYNVSIDYLCGLISTPRTLDGKPYTYISQSGNSGIQINQTGNGSITINERRKKK